MKMSRETIAATLWVAAFALMMFGTIDTVEAHHTSGFLAWGLFFADAALVPTGWCILHREQEEHAIDVEHIAGVVDALHQAKRDLHSV